MKHILSDEIHSSLYEICLILRNSLDLMKFIWSDEIHLILKENADQEVMCLKRQAFAHKQF